VKVQEKAV